MRKLAFIALFISMAAFAANVPQAKINKVNAFIAQTLGPFSEFATVEVTSAATDEKKQLNKIALEAAFKKDGKKIVTVKLGTELKNKKVFLRGSLTGKAKALDMDQAEVLEMLQEARKFVAAINDKGLYKATLKTVGDETKTKMSIRLVPASEEAESINLFKIDVTVPADMEKGQMKASIYGNFNAKGDLVKDAKEGLTGIFNALADSQEPSGEDFEKLGKVFSEIMRNIDMD